MLGRTSWGCLITALLGLTACNRTSPIDSLIGTSPALAASDRVPGRRHVFEVSDFLTESDCPKRKIHGRDQPICDLAKAYERVMKACLSEIDPSWPPVRRAGCALTLAPGVYFQSRAFGDELAESCHAHVLTGAGGGPGEQLTRIYVAEGQDGVHIQGWSRCTSAKQGKSGGQQIRGIAFVSLSKTSTTPSHGVYLEASATIEDVAAEGFTVGFRVDAGTKRKAGTEGNANGFALIRPWARHSQYAGIYIEGPDTNAGYIEQPSAVLNCSRASEWEPRFANIPCAGIHDGSFLGNTLVAGHTASTRDTGQKPFVRKPGYLIGDTPNSRSVCVGCYAEVNQAPSSLGANANALGGIERWSAGPGLGYILGPRAGGMVFSNASGETRLGGHASGAFFELVTPSKLEQAPDMQDVALLLRSDFKLKTFRFDVGHSDRTPLAIRASYQDPKTFGRLSLMLTPVCLGPSPECKAVVAQSPSP